LQILVPRIETMTEQQRSNISNLGKSCQQAEDTLSQGMDKLQQMVLESVVAGQLKEQTNTPNMSTAMERLAGLVSFVNQVRNLLHFLEGKAVSYIQFNFHRFIILPLCQ
ncbi:hypothetical protein S245_066308, partial [Arachis hypogaea]